MSQASWNVVAAPGAERELGNIPDEPRERLTDAIMEMAERPKPLELTCVGQLSGRDNWLKVKRDRYRAIVAHEPPELIVLLVGHRDRVYDRLDVAESRLAGQ